MVRGHTVPPRDPKGRREGFTTGTAAAAAARAAALVLLQIERLPDAYEPAALHLPETVSIRLPIGRTLDIPINRIEYDNGLASAGVVKDAGDDPDVTHGAEIVATVRRVPEPGIHIKGGVGVGTVTRPGLELPVGAPAINPVPLRMIREAVWSVVESQQAAVRGQDSGSRQPESGAEVPPASARCPRSTDSRPLAPGLEVTISVPNGQELARRTFNARLGIVGGISILGTTGIVRAMSTAAWRASVLQAIDVAAANGVEHLVLSTGGRTEKFARRLHPDLPELALVEMGIFTGACLQRAAERGVGRVSLAVMIGKLSKIAAGKLQTHVAGNQVDCGFLADLARELGAEETLVAAIRQANTARHVQELVDSAGFDCFYPALCRRAARTCSAAAPTLHVHVLLFDFNGRLLARAEQAPGGSPKPA
jgi:cobalt-precorrin-5B (C1)-methyltransferase